MVFYIYQFGQSEYKVEPTKDIQQISSTLEKELSTNGVVLIPNLVDEKLVDSLRKQSLDGVNHEAKRMGSSDYEDFGRLLFAPVYGGSFLELLELDFVKELAKKYMDSSPTLYTMTTSCVPPKKSNYTSRIHRDNNIRPAGCVRLLIMQVLLDDFTSENGAPMFLKGSQREETKPSSEKFEADAKMLTGKKGDVIFFDPWIWHRSTQNQSNEWRSCVLLGFVHPWMKQRFDVKSMLKSTDLSNCSEDVIELLGLKNHPPKSWEEFHSNSKPIY
ncbi:MAG: phytanoyl-CoA dioxygenase family protein [Flavobacteriales bacterium]